MNEIIEFLRQHGVMLLAGSSLLMAVGSVGVLLQRSPIQRQRLGEFTLVCVLAWLVLASVPLPRFLADRLQTQAASATVALPSSEVEVAVPVLHFAAETTLAERQARLDQVFAAPVEEVAENDLTGEVFSEPEPISTGATTGLPSSATLADDPADRPSPQPSAEGRGSGGPAMAPAWTASEVLPWLFVAGCTASVVWLGLGQILLVRLCRAPAPIEPWLARLYESLPAGSGRRPRLLVTRQRGQAMSWGLWRPTIAISNELCRPKFAGQLRHVLLHELAHIEQRDARGTLLFNAAFVVLYFHPLYWWLRANVRFAGELIADDWAAEHASPERYAEELMSIVRGFRGGFEHLQATTIFRSPTQFYRRMSMLLERENPLAKGCPRWWTIAYGLVCVAGVGLAAAIVGVAPAAESAANEENEQVEAAVDQALDGIDADVEQALDQALANLDETIDEAVDQAVEQAVAGIRSLDEVAVLGRGMDSLQALEALRAEGLGRLDEAQKRLSEELGNVVNNLKVVQQQELALAKAAGNDDDADSAKSKDDQRRAYERQRRDLEQQKRGLEEKIRALDEKRTGYDEKSKAIERRRDASGVQEVDKEAVKKAAKEAGRKASEEAKRVAESARRAASKAAEQGKEVAEKAKRKATDKVEGEVREKDGRDDQGLKGADAPRERELRDFNVQIERQMKDMQAQIDRRLKGLDERLDRQLKLHDVQLQPGPKELAQRDLGIMRKKETSKEEIEEGASSDDRVRELKRAKEDLGRHVEELEEANKQLTRQVRDMQRAMEDMKRKVKAGGDYVPSEPESPKRAKPAKPAKPSSLPKDAGSEGPSEDATAASTGASRLPAKLISAPWVPAAVTPQTPVAVSPPQTPAAAVTSEPVLAPKAVDLVLDRVVQEKQRPQGKQNPSSGYVGKSSKVEKGEQADDEVRVFRLRNAKASEAEGVVNRLFGDEPIRTSKEDRTNSLVIRAPAATLKRIEALVQQLDEEGENPKSLR